MVDEASFGTGLEHSPEGVKSIKGFIGPWAWVIWSRATWEFANYIPGLVSIRGKEMFGVELQITTRWLQFFFLLLLYFGVAFLRCSFNCSV